MALEAPPAWVHRRCCFQGSVGTRHDQLWELLRLMLDADELEAFEDGDVQKLVANRYFSLGTFRHASRAGLQCALPDAPGLVDILVVKVAEPIAGSSARIPDPSSPLPSALALESSGWPSGEQVVRDTRFGQEWSRLAATRRSKDWNKNKHAADEGASLDDTASAAASVRRSDAGSIVKGYGRISADAEATPLEAESVRRLESSFKERDASAVDDGASSRGRDLAKWQGSRSQSSQPRRRPGEADKAWDDDDDQEWSRNWFERYVKPALLLYRRLASLLLKLRLMGPRALKAVVDVWRGMRGPR